MSTYISSTQHDSQTQAIPYTREQVTAIGLDAAVVHAWDFDKVVISTANVVTSVPDEMGTSALTPSGSAPAYNLESDSPGIGKFRSVQFQSAAQSLRTGTVTPPSDHVIALLIRRYGTTTDDTTFAGYYEGSSIHSARVDGSVSDDYKYKHVSAAGTTTATAETHKINEWQWVFVGVKNGTFSGNAVLRVQNKDFEGAGAAISNSFSGGYFHLGANGSTNTSPSWSVAYACVINISTHYDSVNNRAMLSASDLDKFSRWSAKRWRVTCQRTPHQHFKTALKYHVSADRGVICGTGGYGTSIAGGNPIGGNLATTISGSFGYPRCNIESRGLVNGIRRNEMQSRKGDGGVGAAGARLQAHVPALTFAGTSFFFTLVMNPATLPAYTGFYAYFLADSFHGLSLIRRYELPTHDNVQLQQNNGAFYATPTNQPVVNTWGCYTMGLTSASRVTYRINGTSETFATGASTTITNGDLHIGGLIGGNAIEAGFAAYLLVEGQDEMSAGDITALQPYFTETYGVTI